MEYAARISKVGKHSDVHNLKDMVYDKISITEHVQMCLIYTEY